MSKSSFLFMKVCCRLIGVGNGPLSEGDVGEAFRHGSPQSPGVSNGDGGVLVVVILYGVHHDLEGDEAYSRALVG